MKIEDFFKNNEREIQTIAPRDSVQDAIRKMNQHKVGSCLVVDENEKLIGIITERDVLRAVDDVACELNELAVQSIMTSKLKTGTVADEIDALLTLMSRHRIRHIPILDGDTIVGIVTLAELVAAKLNIVEDERDQLRDYIQQG